MTTKNASLLLLCILFVGVFSACQEDEPDDMVDAYTIPTTYDFANVSYSGQTQRLAMLWEMKNYMATSQTSGVALDVAKLKAMFANEAGAGWDGEYEESKQLQGKTEESAQDDLVTLLEELAVVSQATEAGSDGVSGVIVSTTNPDKQYLIGADGLDHAQVIEKGLMGACLYYQATAVYFGDGKMDVDNVEVTDGKGTEMEHHWDEAFGYFGVPIDFPTSTDGLVFWGDYANKRNALLDCNQPLMEAFLKGRAAISNDDLTARDAAITDARQEWERIAVGSALHYINEGIEKFDDMAIRGHGISEAVGFIYALRFNPDRIISLDQVDELLTLIAGASDFPNMDLYNIVVDDLNSAKDKLAGYYNLDDIKDEL